MAEDSGVIPAELRAALQRISAIDELLIALDFDGVLSPLVPRAEDARMLPGSAAAIKALTALPRTIVALISGRSLESLRAVGNPPAEAMLVGSHGAELWFGEDQERAEALVLSQEQEALLLEVHERLQAVSEHFPGTWVEHKPAGAAIHTRQALSEKDAHDAEHRAAEALEGLGAHLKAGKAVLEASVVKVNKGQALNLLRQQFGASAAFFAGDDLTDEDAFAVMTKPDVSVKVGEGSTDADYRVNSPESVQAVLEKLLQLREKAVATGSKALRDS